MESKAGTLSATLVSSISKRVATPGRPTFRDAVKKGDQVVTIGGLHGKIVSVSEKTVVLEFESGKARVDKAALSPSGTSETQEIEAKA